ncbi:unnamed protein product [Triticum turgidum subsp. durum]|uniref:DUF1618 domain-containing protein n=1 Tax=Triticum turgidum subsp. durum TaxID=4567 RepID=A0A9R0RCW1_TRITD|nr:unnamed protein product [Triticum turgidum subsp. durum]
MVLCSADAFVLLVVPFIHGSRPGPGAQSLRGRSRGSQFGGCGEYNDFFVYRAGPGAPSLSLLPGVDSYRSPDYVTLAGVVPLGGADLNSKDYTVVFPSLSKFRSRYTNDSTRKEYDLYVYRSDISDWQWHNMVSKKNNSEVIMQHEGTRVTFAGRGTLGWVNHWHGILLCNVLDQYPVMRLIEWPVPLPCDLVLRFGMGVDNIYARPFRDVTISNGVIRFVELKSCRCSDTRNEKGVIGQGWTVTTWNREISSNKWQKRFTVKADDVPVTGSSYPKVSGDKRLSWDKMVHGGPTLSLYDDDVVYIMARLDIRHPVAWMLAINIKERTLEAVKQCSAEKMLGLEPTYVQCALSNYLM